MVASTPTPSVPSPPTMLRLTRPLLNVVRKTTTSLVGIPVHPNPLPELVQTYQATLKVVSSLPSTAVYGQAVKALTDKKLGIVNSANGDIAQAEKLLDEGQIEQSILIAKDELGLAQKILEWKA